MKTVKAHLESVSPYSQSKHYLVPKLEREIAADYEERTWRNRMHVDKDGHVMIPPMGLKNTLLLGVPIPSMIINDRFGANWKDDYRIAVIDGKQRITALLMFLRSELPVPGWWFGINAGAVLFSNIPLPQQRCFRNAPVPFSEGRLPTLEAEQEVFDLVNFGGLAQGESDV